MKRTMSATEARKNFFKVIEMAQKPGLPVKITHEGHPTVVMMSEEEFEGWMETLEIMSDPALVKDIKKGLEERDTITFEELERQIRLPAQHVSPSVQKKGKERNRTVALKGSRKTARRSARTSS